LSANGPCWEKSTADGEALLLLLSWLLLLPLLML